MSAERRAYQMTLQKFDLFKTQDPENGRFNVIFEVDGKLLYAHQNMLDLVSDTFDAMLSERWTKKKDEPIKIKDYSYDDFYQFLTFLYSGECELNDSNIFSMVDIAEFYSVRLFKSYLDEYLVTMPLTNQNIFKLIELASKYSLVLLKLSTRYYILQNFQSFADSVGLLNASKFVIEAIITSLKGAVKPEDIFQVVFKWSEKRAMDKQSANPNLNFNDQVKTEISEFLPHIDFRQMDLHFLLEFVVPKGFIFPSLDQLSEILCVCHLQKIQITNSRGQILYGNIKPDKCVLRNIESLNLSICDGGGYDKWCRWNKKFTRPSTASSLKKKDGIEWYLFYFNNGEIGVQHCSFVRENDYLLAELVPGPTGFDTAKGCKILIE